MVPFDMQLIQVRYILPAIKLWRMNSAQALLSMLGVIAGVSGLVIVVALGDGASRELELALGSLGAGSVIVRSTAESSDQSILHGGHTPRIHKLLGQSLIRSAELRNRQLSVSSSARQIEAARVLSTDRNYQLIYKLSLYAGRFISEHDLRNHQRVCVLSWEVARLLFPNGQVLGQQLQIGGDLFKVVGWLAPSARNIPQLDALNVADLDQVVYIPLEHNGVTLDKTPLDEIVLQFNSENNMSTALNVLERVIAPQADVKTIEFIVPIQLLRQKQQLQQLFQYVLLGIAALMLTVGGVGIMNIMMVNVISRRPEIGLRLAIGATRRDIIAQFVTESLVIAVTGGCAGVAFGFLVSALIDWSTTWPIAYNFAAALIGFAVSVTVGVVFGSYPALQAALVSPVQSLNKL